MREAPLADDLWIANGGMAIKSSVMNTRSIFPVVAALLGAITANSFLSSTALANTVSFSEAYADKIGSLREDGFTSYFPYPTGSFTARGKLVLTAEEVAGLKPDENTPVKINVGAWQYEATLGDDDKYVSGKKSVIFRPELGAVIAVAWAVGRTATTVTWSVTAKTGSSASGAQFEVSPAAAELGEGETATIKPADGNTVVCSVAFDAIAAFLEVPLAGAVRYATRRVGGGDDAQEFELKSCAVRGSGVMVRGTPPPPPTPTPTPTPVPTPTPIPVTPVMVRIQGGRMPSPSAFRGRAVATFSMSKYEVTGEEWQNVRAWAVAHGYNDLDSDGRPVGGFPHRSSAVNHPVRDVSYSDVMKWCNAKSEKEGLTPVYQVGEAIYRTGETFPTIVARANGYRLPSELEWEWAARGGLSTAGYTYSGSNDLNAVGWFRDNAQGAAVSLEYDRGTWPVGQKQANELGLYDMTGNVREWCLGDSSRGPTWKVLTCGGSWEDSAEYCAIGTRIRPSSGYSGKGIGFRPARSN